ncbi:MAG: DUF11 domain-containing protein [Polaromonas sp.]|uniref:beta strand repeat-containing protein n=1 Tax=Polaromonas sp. TaxID=1869339 RepID=UPI0018413E00|nr:hypothetical protein [Polaromonas sp.]NMM09456.1 DUF11 domain-containing protein [Polaromonas sp.]
MSSHSNFLKIRQTGRQVSYRHLCLSAVLWFCRRGGGLLLAGLLGFGSSTALAAGGSYATNSTYAQSLWWLDFAGYNDATAAGAAGQPYSFTLPNGAGTLTMTVKKTGPGVLTASTLPSWTGGGAFGNGAYNGITGSPSLYWSTGLSSGGTVTASLTSLVMKDAAGNVRNLSLAAADGEKTDGNGSVEQIVYSSTAAWNQIENVIGYPAYNGGPVVVTGIGSGSVTETGPPTGDNNFNGSVILATLNPTQVSTAFTGNEAAVFAVSLPKITLNLVISGRLNAADQMTASVGYSAPYTNVNSATTSGTGTTATTGANAVIGTNNITLGASMASASVSALSSYNGNISCANSGPGATGYGGVNTALPSGAGTSFTLTPQIGDAIACTLTLTLKTQTVAGAVYNDANHNASQDVGETGTGVSGLYIKLAPSSGGVCSGPATASAAVNTSNGVYSLPNVAQGSYCLILSTNNTLADISATLPSGWIGTQNPSGVVQLSVIGAPPSPQNVGLYNGSKLSGTVFADTGANAGVANNGVKDGGELGIAGVTVNVSAGATTVASVNTAGDGSYALWLPASVSGAVTITPAAPSGYLATGGSAGNTSASSGIYSRPGVSYLPAAGQIYSGVNFGLVPSNTLAPNGAQTAQPGTVVFYAHTFQAGSSGQVTFSLVNAATPASPGWNQVLYQDSNCNGVLDANEPQIVAAVNVSVGQTLCLSVKQFVPAGAALGAQNIVTLNASFSYTNATPALSSTVSASDITTVGQAGALALSKLVSNQTQSLGPATAVNATPGDALQYTLTAVNNGAQPLSALVINDTTPAFTTYVSAACPGALPAGITSCSTSTQPAIGGQGSLQWTFTGSLASATQLVVTYQVRVNQ